MHCNSTCGTCINFFLIVDLVLQVLEAQNVFEPEDIDNALQALGPEVRILSPRCCLLLDEG